MTNEMNFTDIDFDTTHSFDDFDTMLDNINSRNLIPELIDYYYDDAHADPETYILASPTFIAMNNFNIATDSLYTPADQTFTLTNRMILESIAAECADRATELASAQISINNHLYLSRN